jgi:hypothetical protein
MKWLLILLVFVTSANADVIRKHKTSSQSFGSFESTSSEYYKADRSANESTTKWTSGMMKTMTKGKESSSTAITCLDKELIWNVDPSKKTYTEMTFAEFRDMMKKGMQDMESAKAEAEVKDTTSEEMYTWKTEVKSDPNPKTINGWSCKNIHIVATGISKVDTLDRVIITFNMWNSPDVPGAEEIRAFQERYAKALGLDAMAISSGLMNSAAMYEKQMKALMEEAKKAPGEPVTSLIEVKRNQLTGPSIGDAMKEGLMSSLPFGKKKEPENKGPKYEEKVKFSVSTELTEASSGPVDAGKYEIPAGYKLKKK